MGKLRSSDLKPNEYFRKIILGNVFEVKAEFKN